MGVAVKGHCVCRPLGEWSSYRRMVERSRLRGERRGIRGEVGLAAIVLHENQERVSLERRVTCITRLNQ